MALYRYTAVDRHGARHRGALAAGHPAELRRSLRERGMTPLAIEDEDASPLARLAVRLRGTFSGGGEGRFRRRHLLMLTQQLAILLEGGLPLEKALRLLAAQETVPAAKRRLTALHDRIREGVSLADSLAAFPDDFNVMYRTTVAAGEKTGSLSDVLSYLAQYIESQMEIRQKVRMALFYPALLAAFSLSIMVFLLLFIVPELAKAFAHAGHALPFLTQAVLYASGLLRQYGPALLAAAGAAFFLMRRRLNDPARRADWDGRLLRLPVIGRVATDIEISAFVHTLAMLLKSGVTLVESLKVASGVIGNRALGQFTRDATLRVCEGSSLSAALAGGVFPPSFVGLIAGGEASGELNRVLELAARQQAEALRRRAAWFLSILEPCIILITGLMVLLVVLAMMLPILTLNQLVR